MGKLFFQMCMLHVPGLLNGSMNEHASPLSPCLVQASESYGEGGNVIGREADD